MTLYLCFSEPTVMLMLLLDFQGMVLLIYIMVVSLVYLAPLMFTCPCVMDRHHLRARPVVIGRRGAPMVGWCSTDPQMHHFKMLPTF